MPDLDDLLRPLVERPAQEPPPVDDVRRRAQRRTTRRRVATGAVAALVLVAGAAVLASRDDGDLERVGTSDLAGSPAGTVVDPNLPASFDVDGAPALAVPGAATPDDAADAYLAGLTSEASKATGLQVRRVGGSRVDETGTHATAEWELDASMGPDGPAMVTTGRLQLRAEPSEGAATWYVVASSTDAVDLAAFVNRDGAVAADVTSRIGGVLFVDVTSLGGEPLAASPFPDGATDLDPDIRYGTAGVLRPSVPGPLLVDIPLGDEPTPLVNVRLQVGGELVLVAQVALPSPPPPGVTTVVAAPTTTTTGPPTTTSTVEDQTPPWAAAPLSAAQAPATAEAFAREGSPGEECPAIAPADLGEGAGATSRATDRGSPGAWWVAYDLPGAPGEAEIQSPSADAGKETFSVSAVTFPMDVGSVVDRFPNQVRWSDGSHGSYGVEGGGILPTEGEMEPAWLAYLKIGDSPCLYQVHTYLGQDHMEHLLSQLRFVEGSP